MPLAFVAALLLPFHLAGQTTRVPQGAAPEAQVSGTSLTPEAQARLKELQGSLNTAVAARDPRTAGKLLNQIGELWLRSGNLQNALEAYNHAVAAARLAQDA